MKGWRAFGAALALVAGSLSTSAPPSAAAAPSHYLPSSTAQNVTYFGYFVTDVRCDFSFAYGNFKGVAFARVSLISSGCAGALVEVFGVVDRNGCCAWRYAETTRSGQAQLPLFSSIVYPRWAIVTPGYNPEALCFGYDVFTGRLDDVSYGGRIVAECI